MIKNGHLRTSSYKFRFSFIIKKTKNEYDYRLEECRQQALKGEYKDFPKTNWILWL